MESARQNKRVRITEFIHCNQLHFLTNEKKIEKCTCTAILNALNNVVGSFFAHLTKLELIYREGFASCDHQKIMVFGRQSY